MCNVMLYPGTTKVKGPLSFEKQYHKAWNHETKDKCRGGTLLIYPSTGWNPLKSTLVPCLEMTPMVYDRL